VLLRAWRRWRDDAALARRTIPDDLWKRTLVRWPFLRRREPADAAELRRLTSLFLDRKEFSAAGGLRMSDAIAVGIAAQAVLPVLRLGLAAYDGFVGIVVHPGPVRARRQQHDESGLVHEYDEELAGEAMEGGPVMLSWQDVRAGGGSSGDAGGAYNVVIHEFAHVLDMANGDSDGVPILPPGIAPSEWSAILRSEFERFVTRVDAEEPTALDPYGAVGEDEFFAVASESFFVDPLPMKEEHPDLYRVFARFYRQDPAADTAWR
jgi:Mlc titration factor MtfA (ptsG expression regulator)